MQTDTIFNHETVVLDDESFSDCEFRSCRMVFSGGAPPVFVSCRFDACDWKFEGAAANTLAQLKLLWGVGGKATVQALIKDITAVK